MKTTILTFALLVSSFVFTQETWSHIDFDQAEYLFDVKIPDGKKFVYLDPKTYTFYSNVAHGGDDAFIDSNASKVLGLDTKECSKFHKDIRSDNYQTVFGFEWMIFNKLDKEKVLNIMNNSKSTREAIDLLKSLKSYEKFASSLGNYNKEATGNYYTISGFYYTIEEEKNDEIILRFIYPIGKEVAFKHSF